MHYVTPRQKEKEHVRFDNAAYSPALLIPHVSSRGQLVRKASESSLSYQNRHGSHRPPFFHIDKDSNATNWLIGT